MRLKDALSAALLALCLVGVSAQAQGVQVDDAWVRSTVAGQKGSGAFMKITAKEGTRLTGVSSPVAGVAEVHEMKMDGDVMRMRAVPVLELPAGKTVELKPGGYHLMLMDLKQPLAAGSSVGLTLHFKNAQGVESHQLLALPVAATAPRAAGARGVPAAPATSGMDSGAHKH